MSFDVFVQGFRGGAARDLDPAIVRAILEPFVAEREPGNGFARLRLPDGEAELYGVDRGSSLMLSRFSGDAIWDLLVELAARADLTILMPGGPIAIGSERARADLPPELAADVIVVASGAELRRAFGLA